MSEKKKKPGGGAEFMRGKGLVNVQAPMTKEKRQRIAQAASLAGFSTGWFTTAAADLLADEVFRLFREGKTTEDICKKLGLTTKGEG